MNNHQSSRGDEVSQKGGYLKKNPETIKMIFDALTLDKGNFVPICGFEIVSDEKYNTIPEDLLKEPYKEIISVLGGTPLLISEEKKIQERLRACWQFFKDKELYEGKKEDAIQEKINYYTGLKKYIGKQIPPAVSSKVADHNDWIVLFLINLFELTYALTILWAKGLSRNPQPFGNQKILTSKADEEITRKSLLATQRVLNCCVRQYEKSRKESSNGNSTDLLHIKWIYCKLLYLFSQIFGSDDRLWETEDSPCQAPEPSDSEKQSEPEPLCYQLGKCDKFSNNDFIGIHFKLIKILDSEVTNWKVENNEIIKKEGPAKGCIDLHHIQWLQRLIRHVLLHQTRRFRTREELAFMLSLDDEVKGLPGETFDPFELGSLFAIKDQFDTRLLKETLRYCEGDDEPNPPQPFFWSLASMLKQYPSSNSLGQHILLSLSLDRELERALSYWFDSFHLLVPVNITEEFEGQEAIWLLGYCTSEKNQSGKPIGRYTIDKWQMIYRNEQKNDDSVWQESKGPLIVKFFGAPLEDIPESDDLRYDQGEVNIIEVQHRIVLDESRLWRSLSDQLELPSNVKIPTGTAFRCFFGQDAIRWSERLPFYKLNTLNNEGEKEGDPTLAISKFGVCGETIFQKLKIDHNNDPEDVIKEFIRKAVKEQKPGQEGDDE